MNPLLNEWLDIEPKQIKAKYDNTSVTINTSDYGDDITETNLGFNMVGIFDVFVMANKAKTRIPIVFNHTVTLVKSKSLDIDRNQITINYDKGDVIVNGESKQSEIGVSGLVKLLNSRADFIKDPAILLTLLSEELPEIDLIHFEVIVSNMVRSAEDPIKLGRHCPKSEKTMIYGNLKIASTDSLLTSLAFRNINRSIENGLLNSNKTKPNIIDKVISANM